MGTPPRGTSDVTVHVAGNLRVWGVGSSVASRFLTEFRETPVRSRGSTGSRGAGMGARRAARAAAARAGGAQGWVPEVPLSR